MNASDTAYLSNRDGYISFAFGGRVIRFKAPYSLVRIEDVSVWDNGYIVVNARYAHQKEPVEDYIDLVPILNDLYIDAGEFLKPIRNVEVAYV